MTDVSYPFSLTEDQIIEVLEVVEDAYCPSAGVEAFIKKMNAIRDKAAEQRLKEWGELLEEHTDE